jgi:mono/diheme cytochrome c family protein
MSLNFRRYYKMMGAAIFAASLPTAASLEAYAQTGVAATTGSTHAQINQGELEFRLYCAQCHGLEATGNGPIARALKKKPANLRMLTKDNAGIFPEQKIRDFIDGVKDIAAHGGREMPIWGLVFQARTNVRPESGAPPISQEEVNHRIDLLVDYIKSIQRN